MLPLFELSIDIVLRLNFVAGVLLQSLARGILNDLIGFFLHDIEWTALNRVILELIGKALDSLDELLVVILAVHWVILSLDLLILLDHLHSCLLIRLGVVLNAVIVIDQFGILGLLSIKVVEPTLALSLELFHHQVGLGWLRRVDLIPLGSSSTCWAML